MFWLLLLGLLVFLLLWLLIAPIYLWIEWTPAGRGVEIHWKGVIRLGLLPVAEEWRVQIRLLFFRREWPLFELLTKTSKQKPQQEAAPKAKSWRRIKHPLRLVQDLWRSFRLHRLYLDLDTDDYILNAYLFPLFRTTNPGGRVNWAINFQGRNEIYLLIENRLYRLLYAFIRAAV